MLELPAVLLDEMIAHAYDAYPYECCGLLAGPLDTGVATRFYACRNAAESAKVYTVDPREHLRAERDAEAQGWDIVGVVHSHTHTEPYPSPTDVVQAPDPAWHYVIIGLKRESPEVRSYRIVAAEVREEPLVVA